MPDTQNIKSSDQINNHSSTQKAPSSVKLKPSKALCINLCFLALYYVLDTWSPHHHDAAITLYPIFTWSRPACHCLDASWKRTRNCQATRHCFAKGIYESQVDAPSHQSRWVVRSTTQEFTGQVSNSFQVIAYLGQKQWCLDPESIWHKKIRWKGLGVNRSIRGKGAGQHILARMPSGICGLISVINLGKTVMMQP